MIEHCKLFLSILIGILLYTTWIGFEVVRFRRNRCRMLRNVCSAPFVLQLFTIRFSLFPFVCRFRFWQWGRWIEVKVDDRLPTRGDRPAHMHCAQPDVFWGALLEKAYAKLYGGYAFLKYGTVGRALQDLTGAVVQSVPPSGPLLGGAVPRSTLLLAITGTVSQNSPIKIAIFHLARETNFNG